MADSYGARRVLFALSVLLLLAAVPHIAFAARLFLTPTSNTFSPVGQTVSVSVVLSSTDQPANAVSGVLTFPPNKFQVVSLSKTSSILSLWVEEPTYSNIAGTISFQGIVPNPGYQGGRGIVLIATLKAVAAGPASISFSQASVLANDGSGTDILTDFQGASFSLTGSAGEQAPGAGDVTASGQIISSPAHPSPNKWYSKTTAELNWNISSGITASRYTLDNSEKTTPSTVNTPAIKTKTFENLEEGTWYFHLQLKNAAGWGSVANFRMQIDTTPPTTPEFELMSGDSTNNFPRLLVKSTDDLSGIASFRVKFGDKAYETFNVPDDSGQMIIPAKHPGKQTIIVEAYDQAGNKSIAAKELDIETIEAPKITDMPSILDKGQDLVIRGTAISDTEVRVHLKDSDDKEVFESTRSGAAGDFQLTWKEPIADGKYIVTAEAVNSFGVISPRSAAKSLSVHPSILFRIGSFVVTVGSFVMFMLVVLIGVVYGSLILYKHFHRFRRSLSREMDQIDRSVHTAFNMLKDEVRKEVKNLERAKTKRKLTQEEERIIERFSADVDDAERFIEKQIRDVKKDVG